MPKNSSARREKDKKRKDKKKKTDPLPLHKEDKTSVDGSTLSPSLAGANSGRTVSSANAKNKDASLPRSVVFRNSQGHSTPVVECRAKVERSCEEGKQAIPL
jgi:hypothetical protein